MPRLFLIFRQSNYLIQIVDINSHNGKQGSSRSVGLKKPTDLDLNCLQMQDISGFSRTRFNIYKSGFSSCLGSSKSVEGTSPKLFMTCQALFSQIIQKKIKMLPATVVISTLRVKQILLGLFLHLLRQGHKNFYILGSQNKHTCRNISEDNQEMLQS